MYTRVSTAEQTVENQRRKLAAVANIKGWTLVGEYSDAGASGAKKRAERPGLDAALKAAAAGQYDVLMAWSVDRLGRSLADLIATANSLRSAGVSLYFDQQAIDTTTPAGVMFYRILGALGALAEFERTQIRARVQAGLARARAAGKHLGRPCLPKETEERVRAALAEGKTVRAICREVGIGHSAVRRIRDAG